MAKEDPIFPDGFRAFDAKPEWLMTTILINLPEFVAWAKENMDENKEVKLDVKRSQRTQKLYAQLNTWKPQPALDDDVPF